MRHISLFLRNGLLLALFSLFCGCSFAPDYTRPDVETPKEWNNEAVESPQTQITKDWWKSFGSTELDNAMALALADNNDLRAALHRIEQARAEVKIAGAALLPSAAATGNFSRTRSSINNGAVTWQNLTNAGAGLSYELDLFGANRSVAMSASAAYQGSQFDRDALALVIMGDVAQRYFTLLDVRQRITISQGNLKIAREVLAVIQAKYDAGALSGVELAQQMGTVANAEASVASLVGQENLARNALAILLGRAPQSLDITATSLDNMIMPVIAAGQPSTLIMRRPDINSAEAALQAANGDIGAARAAFFPNVTLGLDWIIAKNSLTDLTTKTLSLGSGLTAPIFQGGRLKGGVEKARARQAELVENYRKIVLVSFQEVEDALGTVKATETQQTALKRAMIESRRAYDLSLAQYKAGAIDFQTLLTVQQTLFNAEDLYAQAYLALLSSAVDLFKALGGGWQQPIY